MEGSVATHRVGDVAAFDKPNGQQDLVFHRGARAKLRMGLPSVKERLELSDHVKVLAHIGREDAAGQNGAERVGGAVVEQGTKAVVAKHAQEGDGVKVLEDGLAPKDLGQRRTSIDLRIRQLSAMRNTQARRGEWRTRYALLKPGWPTSCPAQASNNANPSKAVKT